MYPANKEWVITKPSPAPGAGYSFGNKHTISIYNQCIEKYFLQCILDVK